jgi:hypothetical protein
MPSKHINRKRIPRCLSLSWPPPDDDDDDDDDEVAPMGSRPSW